MDKPTFAASFFSCSLKAADAAALTAEPLPAPPLPGPDPLTKASMPGSIAEALLLEAAIETTAAPPLLRRLAGLAADRRRVAGRAGPRGALRHPRSAASAMTMAKPSTRRGAPASAAPLAPPRDRLVLLLFRILSDKGASSYVRTAGDGADHCSPDGQLGVHD